MPFTLAHPAIVLPLRRVLWFPALAVGAMAPDLAYYLPTPVDTHSLVGMVTVDLVIGFVLLAAVTVAQRPFLALCGNGIRARAPRMSRPGAGMIVGSLAVGAASHLAWDAFTHTHGYVVRNWPLMRISVVGPHRLYNVFGYVSAVGGLLILLIVVLRWYRRTPPAEPWIPAARHRLRAFGGIAAATAVGAAIALADPVSRVSAYDWVRQLLLGGTQGAAVAFALYVVLFYVSRPR